MSKDATTSEKEHMATVKSMPCVVCAPEWFEMWQAIPMPDYGNMSEYDHLVDGYRLGHMFGIPLCNRHHQGKKGYGDPSFHWDSSKPNQWKLLEKVYAVLGKDIPPYNPKINNFKERNA